MCGRFALDVHGETVCDSFDWIDRSRSRSEMVPSSNIAPTTQALVIGKRVGARATLQPMRWGLSRPGGRPVINARIETADQRPMFRRAFARGRCLVLASGYYEWFDAGAGKRAYYGVDSRGQLLLMAGLYAKNEGGIHGFVVVTRPAVGKAAEYHPRMPALVPANDADRWLSEEDPRNEILAWTPELAWSRQDPAERKLGSAPPKRESRPRDPSKGDS